MSGRESSPKISLALLKGRGTNQSVPSISFRFDPSAENITQVSDPEEEEEDPSGDVSMGLEAGGGSVGSSVGRAESLRDTSPSKEPLGRSLGKRSSSLDSNSGPPLEAAPPPQRPVEGGGGGLLSRITKTFEEKINEIRKDKEASRGSCVSEGSTESEGGADRSPSTATSPLTAKERRDEEERSLSKSDLGGSPQAKGKASSLVHDLTEHTSKKIKSELGSIRPKLSELRHRRSSKDASPSASTSKSSTTSKGKASVFTSLLGRDEGLGEEMLLECDESEVDRAEEAIEGAFLYQSEQSAVPEATQDASTAPAEAPVPRRIPPQEPTFKGQVFEAAGQLPLTRSLLYKFLAAIFTVTFLLPIPSYLSGLVVGMMVSGMLCHCLLHLLMPPVPEPPPPPDEGPVLLTLPNYEDKQWYKGWLNKLEGEYSPDTYHVSLTHSVFARLQGSKLQLDFPRGKVPKHARLKEELRHLTFTHHLEYDLAGCQVMLLPKNLPRRWLWSRKYPICIRLQAGSKESSPSPVSIASTPAGSAHGSPTHFVSPELGGRQGSSESGEGNWSLENNNRSSGEDDLMNSSLDMASFEEVTQDMCQEKSLFLFARTDREKDDWYRCLVAASELSPPPRAASQASPSHRPSSAPEPGDTVHLEGLADTTPGQAHQEGGAAATPPEMNFERYMARLLYQPASQAPTSFSEPANVAWINALAGRLFYDFLRNPIWANKVQERVQRKLSKLHVPYFVGELVVCGVNMGSATPQLCAAGKPHIDRRGLWVDLEVEYSGNFTLSLETKLDLMKLKRTTGLDHNPTHSLGHSSSSPPSPGEPAHPRVYTRSPSSDRLLRNLHFDTDTDDSVESSSEEEGEEEGVAAEAGLPAGGSGPTSRRLLKLVDTVAASRYFQHAAEWRLLQRALQGVSNTRIELSVEVRRLAGTLALNVPPPPADRLWYGFRGVPELSTVARPRLGERVLSLPILVEFIQKQLRVIFEKVFVLPNMDDLVIPIMSPLLPGQRQPPRPPWEAAQHPSLASVLTPVVKFTPSSH